MTNSNGQTQQANRSGNTTRTQPVQPAAEVGLIGKIKETVQDVRSAIRKRPLVWTAIAYLLGDMFGG